MLIVADEPCNLVPDRPPRQARKAEPRRKAGGITKWEIEAYENPGIARHRRRQPFCQEGLCGVPGSRVDKSFARGIDPADPDTVAAGPRHAKRPSQTCRTSAAPRSGRGAVAQLAHAIVERAEHLWMVAQIECLDKFD